MNYIYKFLLGFVLGAGIWSFVLVPFLLIVAGKIGAEEIRLLAASGWAIGCVCGLISLAND